MAADLLSAVATSLSVKRRHPFSSFYRCLGIHAAVAVAGAMGLAIGSQRIGANADMPSALPLTLIRNAASPPPHEATVEHEQKKTQSPRIFMVSSSSTIDPRLST